MSPFVHPFFDPATHSFSYVVVDPPSRKCAIIDPELNYERETATASATSADAMLEFARANDLLVEWILETHVHADHVSAARYLRSRLPAAQLAVSVGVLQVQRQMANRFGEADHLVLTITPEGTRSRADHWKSGFYHSAREAGVPIVLAGIDYGPAYVGMKNNKKAAENFEVMFGSKTEKHRRDYTAFDIALGHRLEGRAFEFRVDAKFIHGVP